MMIKTPVDFDSESVYSDVDGDVLFDTNYICEHEVIDLVKRINMHDELIKSLHAMVEVVGSNFCQNMEIKRKYKIARELLERCK